VTRSGRLFQTRAAATAKARSPTVDSRARLTISDEDELERSRWQCVLFHNSVRTATRITATLLSSISISNIYTVINLSLSFYSTLGHLPQNNCQCIENVGITVESSWRKSIRIDFLAWIEQKYCFGRIVMHWHLKRTLITSETFQPVTRKSMLMSMSRNNTFNALNTLVYENKNVFSDCL